MIVIQNWKRYKLDNEIDNTRNKGPTAGTVAKYHKEQRISLYKLLDIVLRCLQWTTSEKNRLNIGFTMVNKDYFIVK